MSAVAAAPCRPWFLALVTAAGLAAACGDGGADDDDGGGDLPEAIDGTISLVEYDAAFDDWAGVDGHFVPAAEADALIDDGTCRVFRQPCLGSVGACGRPPGVDVGPLAVDGLAAPLTIEPGFEASYYATLPDDAFAAGDPITVSADGPLPFALTVDGVAPMKSELVGATVGPFAGPVSFDWTPGDDGARVRLSLNIADLCHAGADWLVLECEVDDVGTLTVPDPVLDVLPAGYGGCGGALARVRHDVAEVGDHRVRVEVRSADFLDFFELRAP